MELFHRVFCGIALPIRFLAIQLASGKIHDWHLTSSASFFAISFALITAWADSLRRCPAGPHLFSIISSIASAIVVETIGRKFPTLTSSEIRMKKKGILNCLHDYSCTSRLRCWRRKWSFLHTFDLVVVRSSGSRLIVESLHPCSFSFSSIFWATKRPSSFFWHALWIKSLKSILSIKCFPKKRLNKKKDHETGEIQC